MLTENSQDVSSGRESTKTILKVREKAMDVKMFSQTIIINRLKDLTNNRKKAYRTILTCIRFLKPGTTDEDFQQEGKQDSAKHLLYRTGESFGQHILRTMGGILSGPVALDTSIS